MEDTVGTGLKILEEVEVKNMRSPAEMNKECWGMYETVSDSGRDKRKMEGSQQLALPSF